MPSSPPKPNKAVHGPSVGIYCDVGASRGAGHFMRSVAVGAALAHQGVSVTVAGTVSQLSWAGEIARGYGIDTTDCESVEGLAPLASRLGWDALLLDSYEITASDLDAIEIPIVAIDDQALRPLPVQLVVNPNLSSRSRDYRGWPTQNVLRGAQYTLLRPELVAARPAVYRERDWMGGRQRVLIMCGGTDAGGAATMLTERVLTTLPDVDVRVLATGPPVGGLAVPSGSTVTVLEPTPSIGPLIDQADLVVTTAGTTVWELCCLGAPMALVIVADNQREHCQAALDAGIAVGMGTLPELAAVPTLPHTATLRSPAELNRLGRRAWETVDGRGAQRVSEAVLALVQQIAVRAANEADSPFIFQWRNDPTTRRGSRNTDEISWAGHQRWLANVLVDKARELLIVEHLGEPVAVLRFDRADDTGQNGPPEWEISINIAPRRRGDGLAAPAVTAGHSWLRRHYDRGSVVGITRTGNQAMLATFRRCGYRETSRDDAWVALRYEL